MSVRVRLPRHRAQFWGGPLDGSARDLEGEAPAFLVHKAEGEAGMREYSREGEVPVLMHRYRRETEVGGLAGWRIWFYRHEGSVSV